jgi:hypothetical protein
VNHGRKRRGAIKRTPKWKPAAHLAALEKEVKSWGDSYSFEFGISLLD